MNQRDVIQFIASRTSVEELKPLNDALRRAWRQANMKAASTWAPGDKVTFTGRGVTYTGTVVKVNQKTVSVVTIPQNLRWKVSGSLLKAAP